MKHLSARVLAPVALFALTSCATAPATQGSNATSSSALQSSGFSSTATSSAQRVTLVRGVCGGDVPSTWHVRSAADQAIWNREGNITPPSILTADLIFEALYKGDAVPFKPAIFSMASADTVLAGHAEDPGAEDANREEIDVLHITGKDVNALLARVRALQTPLNSYYATTSVIGDREALVLRNVYSGGKYYGMELMIVPESAPGKEDGFIFHNRSNDAEFDLRTRTPFRLAAEDFFETVNIAECPQEWTAQ